VTRFSGLLVLYFVALVVVSRWRSAAVPSRAVQLLRAFFPSWRFFEDVGDVLTLQLRVGAGDDTLGPWQPALPRPRRRLGMLLVASEVNFLLAAGSLLQQLHAELADADPDHPERLTAAVPYRLTRDLVRYRLRASGAAPGSRYQWKLHAAPADGTAGEDVLIAPIDGLAISSSDGLA
jgi:hypothetical protein